MKSMAIQVTSKKMVKNAKLQVRVKSKDKGTSTLIVLLVNNYHPCMGSNANWKPYS